MKTTSTPFKPIGDHVESIDTWSPTSACADSDFQYIDIASVDRESKRIISTTAISPVTAPSRARQLVHVGDVLVSTVRPNLNAVAMVPEKLSEAIASTGFCVLRCNPKTLDRRYLFHWVRTTAFVADMVRKATGASYPAVSDRIIKESSIPLPPLPEQKRIANILDKADAIRRKRQKAMSSASDLQRSLYLSLFGDPLANPFGWNIAAFGEVCERMHQGINTVADRVQYTNVGYPIIQSKHFTKGQLDLSDTRFVSESDFERYRDKYAPKPSDLLVANIGTIGKSLLLAESEDFLIAWNVFLVKLDQRLILPRYAFFFLEELARKRFYDQFMTGGTVKFVNKNTMRRLPLPMPPLSLQHGFDEQLTQIDSAVSHHRSALLESDGLFNSLVQDAFKGEL